MVGLDGPVDAAQQVRLPPDDVDPGHLDDRLAVAASCARHAPIQPTRRAAPAARRGRSLARSPGDPIAPPVEVLPGSPAPLGAHWDGTGTNFALWSAGAPGGRPVPVRRRRAPSTGTGWRRRPTRSGTAGCPASARDSGTATACTAPTTRSPGLRHNPAKLLLDPYARAVDGDLALHPALFGYPGDAVDGTAPRPAGLGAVRAARASSSTTRSRGTATGRCAPRGRTRSSTRCTSRARPRCTPTSPPHLRGTYAGLAHPAFVEHLQRAGRHRRRAAAGAPLRQRAAPAAPGADATTGATTPSATSPRTPPTAPRAAAAGRSPSSRRWSRSCTPPASR